MRDNCSFCRYWWHCGPSLFKLFFHNNVLHAEVYTFVHRQLSSFNERKILIERNGRILVHCNGLTQQPQPENVIVNDYLAPYIVATPFASQLNCSALLQFQWLSINDDRQKWQAGLTQHYWSMKIKCPTAFSVVCGLFPLVCSDAEVRTACHFE